MPGATDLKWEDIEKLAELREKDPKAFRNKLHWLTTTMEELSIGLLDVSLKVDDYLKKEQSKRNAEIAKTKAKEAGVDIDKKIKAAKEIKAATGKTVSASIK